MPLGANRPAVSGYPFFKAPPMNMHAADPAAQEPEPFSVSTEVSLQERRYRTIKSGDTFGQGVTLFALVQASLAMLPELR